MIKFMLKKHKWYICVIVTLNASRYDDMSQLFINICWAILDFMQHGETKPHFHQSKSISNKHKLTKQ